MKLIYSIDRYKSYNTIRMKKSNLLKENMSLKSNDNQKEQNLNLNNSLIHKISVRKIKNKFVRWTKEEVTI